MSDIGHDTIRLADDDYERNGGVGNCIVRDHDTGKCYAAIVVGEKDHDQLISLIGEMQGLKTRKKRAKK